MVTRLEGAAQHGQVIRNVVAHLLVGTLVGRLLVAYRWVLGVILEVLLVERREMLIINCLSPLQLRRVRLAQILKELFVSYALRHGLIFQIFIQIKIRKYL